jgi:uncharacterized protein DUF3987
MPRRYRPQPTPVPSLITEPDVPVPPFPVEVFPAPLARFVSEVAASLPCPPDFVGVPLLAVLGTAIGTSRVLEVKPGWREGPRLFTAVVADPGSKKSPALALVMQPVRERQQQLQAAAQQVRPADAAPDLPQTGDRLSPGDPGEAPSASPPLLPQLYTTDATLEALIQLLRHHPRGVLFARDELTAWVLGMNQYRGGRGADRQQWLSLWNGAESIVNRKTRREVTAVPNPFVGVTGCLPPTVLPDLAAPLRRADGLLDRLLFAFPDASPPRWTDVTVTEAAMAGYTQILAALWQLNPACASEGHGSRPVVVPFTVEGRSAFVRCVNDLYAQLMDPELPAHLRGPYAKLEGYAARLALLVQLCRHVAGEAAHTAVDARSVTAAAALIEYFQAHLIRVYTCLRSTQADQRAVTALRWIRAHGRACTVRDLQRHRVAGVTRASQGEKLLRDLVDLGAGELRARRLPSGRTQRVFVMQASPSSSRIS